MAPFPLFKLGALLAKQISKPLSRIIKERATQNKFLRNYLVIPSAQAYHKMDINIRMKLLGLGSPDTVPPLTEKAAIELGSDLLSDFFVFGTAAGAIILEYIRQSHNKTTKDTEFANKVDKIDTRNDQVYKDVEKHKKLLEDLNKSLNESVKKLELLNKKVNELEKTNKIKFQTQSTQTSVEKPVGKILYPLNSPVKPSADVRNSIMYQCADDATFSLFGRTL